MLRVVGFVLVSMGLAYLFESLLGEPIFPWRRWRWELVRTLGLSPRLWLVVQSTVLIVVGIALIVWGG